jgi:Recombinase
LFNDRLLLGLKRTMSEAELHVLRARLNGGIRNKAARGELRRGLPVGFVWGDEDGEVRFHPDEAVCAAIRTVLAKFNELGSVRRVWLWLRSEGLSFPLQTRYGGSIRWVDPSYIAIYHVLTNPVYAGAYAYGKSRCEVTLDRSGARKKRMRKCRNRNGPCSSPIIIQASSTGAPMRPIASASAPTRIRGLINRAAAP